MKLEHQTCNLDFIHSSSSPCLSLVFLLVAQSLTQLGSMLVCIYLNCLFHILFTLVLQAPFKEGWRGLGGDEGCQTVVIRIVFGFQIHLDLVGVHNTVQRQKILTIISVTSSNYNAQRDQNFAQYTKAVTIEKENRQLHVSPHNHPIY